MIGCAWFDDSKLDTNQHRDTHDTLSSFDRSRKIMHEQHCKAQVRRVAAEARTCNSKPVQPMLPTPLHISVRSGY